MVREEEVVVVWVVESFKRLGLCYGGCGFIRQ